jgi:hypothetical protein
LDLNGGLLTALTLNLTGTSNQIVLQSGGVTGTITWTPATSNKIVTVPNETMTLAGRDVANTFAAVQTINLNAVALPAPLAGTIIHIGNADSTQSILAMDAFASNPSMVWRRANNTDASPSAVSSNDQLGNFLAYGYGATGYSAAARGYIAIRASENWTDAAQGTLWQFASTVTGGTTTAVRLTITGTGGVVVAGAFGCNGATAQAAYIVGAAAPAGGAGATAGAYDTAAHRDAMIALVNNMRTALINNGIAVAA